jgi:hypothetical protein
VTETGPKRHPHVTQALLSSRTFQNIAGEPLSQPALNLKDGNEMKRALAVLLPLAFCATSAFAWGEGATVVRWASIVGVITAPAVDNPVAGIKAGAGPWSVRNGHARVNLSNGNTTFDVDGLVLNGGNSTGTPGPVTSVTGTLVCGAGTTTQSIHDTTAVSLNTQGDAHFSGQISGVPAACDNPLFLIRIAAPAGAAGRWIATAGERHIED